MNKFMSGALSLTAAFAIVGGPLAATANADTNGPYQAYCPDHTEPKWQSSGDNTWYICVPTVERHR
jgi:hypothetical protein